YKEDWPEARERILAWWEGEIIDRVAIKVTAPRKRPPHVPVPPNLSARWTDSEYLIAANEAAIESRFWGGESIPCVLVNLGPSVIGAYLGCPLRHDERTGWQLPIVHEPSDWARVEFSPENRWWQLTKRLTESFVEAGAGKYFVCVTDLGGATDVMSYLRTPEALCLDLVEIPDTLRAIRSRLLELWFRLYDELHSIIQRKMAGSASWLQVWSPRKTYTLQCDFSCMISPDMYRDFVLPEIVAQSKWLDHTIYHLDGPGAIGHLDALLELPELNGIQWVPGAGAPPEKDWPELLKRVQGAGKLLHIGVSKCDIEPLLEIVSPKGLMIGTTCDSEEEARDLLKKAQGWTARALATRGS
nr:hypothetical protein [Anaerolineae bacterium]NIQ79972.1 hypothetical protein [Anaerolineae bacterium]